MTTQPRNYNHPGNQKEPEKKHPYLFYWLTGGLATIIAAIIAASAIRPGPGSVNPSPGPTGTSTETGGTSTGSDSASPGPLALSGNGLLTSDDMGEAAGGFWSPPAADAQSLSFSCFPLPGSPIKSAAVEFESGSGAKLWEVVDTFSSADPASQAYANFANTAVTPTGYRISGGRDSEDRVDGCLLPVRREGISDETDAAGVHG